MGDQGAGPPKDDLAAQTAKVKGRSGKSLQFESRDAGVTEIAK